MHIDQYLVKSVLVVIVFVVLGACSDANQTQNGVTQNSIHLTVHKRIKCSCCSKWIHHMRENGFTTTSNNQNDLSDIKQKYGIHKTLGSCHTSVTDDGFVFEGHIPAKFIQKFLDEKPQDARGLAVPAMPTGTPGMEFGDMLQPYRIYLLKNDGSIEIYAEVNSAKEQI